MFTGPLAYQFKDGSSRYWTGIQVRNHRYPIATLEARDTAAHFSSIARLERFKFFVEPDGLGVGAVSRFSSRIRAATYVEDTSIAVRGRT